MIKGTITLKNGVMSQFECATHQEYASILSSLDATKTTKVNDTKISVNTKKPLGMRRTTAKRWTHDEIVGMGNIVKNNLSMKAGVSSLVAQFLRKNGFPTRTNSSLYSTTSNIKLYLTGRNPAAATQKMKRILNDVGIYPVAK